LSDLRDIAKERVGCIARKWTLDSLIDVGGMAAVYRATHRNGNRVAIKVLHPTLAVDPELRERFLREGYLANRVGHKNALTVLDDDELDDGTPFLVMELLEGRSLSSWLEQRQILEPAEILYVADRVLDVLATAHERYIIHRDIKPGNVFLTTDGSVKVLDFGLARVLGSDKARTRPGVVVGTASYLSPEQAAGKRDKVDRRTDIWSVGAMIFKALTGRPVHLGETQIDRMLAAAIKPAPSLEEVAPELAALSTGLVVLVDRALAFDKRDRWPYAKTMQDALRRVYRDLEDMAIPVSQRVHDLAPWKSPGEQLRSVPPPATVPTRVNQAGATCVETETDPAGDTLVEAETGDSILVDFDDEPTWHRD